jgi:hypothetical protein
MRVISYLSGLAAVAGLTCAIPSAAHRNSTSIAAVAPRADISRYDGDLAAWEREVFLEKLCVHQYEFLYEQWMVQIPEKYWRAKYGGHADLACHAWKANLESYHMCGLMFRACNEIPRGQGIAENHFGRPGWLQLRATTCIGPNENQFQSSMHSLFDINDDQFDYKCAYGTFNGA